MEQALSQKLRTLNNRHANLREEDLYWSNPNYSEVFTDLYKESKEIYPLVILQFLSKYEWLESCHIELTGASNEPNWIMKNINNTDFSVTFKVRYYVPNPFQSDLLTEQDKAKLIEANIKAPLYESFIDDFIDFARNHLSEQLYYPSLNYTKEA